MTLKFPFGRFSQTNGQKTNLRVEEIEVLRVDMWVRIHSNIPEIILLHLQTCARLVTLKMRLCNEMGTLELPSDA